MSEPIPFHPINPIPFHPAGTRYLSDDRAPSAECVSQKHDNCRGYGYSSRMMRATSCPCDCGHTGPVALEEWKRYPDGGMTRPSNQIARRPAKPMGPVSPCTNCAAAADHVARLETQLRQLMDDHISLLRRVHTMAATLPPSHAE